MNPELHTRVLDRATAPYFDTGRFNRYWSRGKLGRDPIFAALLTRGMFHDAARILDLGCGRGLLAAWLYAAEQIADEGTWPTDLPAPPRHVHFRGIELMGAEADCGNHALTIFNRDARLAQGMCAMSLGNPDVIAMLDVLHYIDIPAQDALSSTASARPCRPAGLFLTRVGDAAGGLPFRFSQLVDHCMAFAQGHGVARMWCRPLQAWVDALSARGFQVSTLPMSEGTPFANVMIEARLP
ncbi:MAG: methyltransferase type 11 [Uliginosibacterium sp.]|nr:methyltransferase type 11 [Uliginosibacterium sp.]